MPPVERTPSARGRRPHSPSSASARARCSATGGGSICREENYPLLHQNGTIFWLQRDLALLPKDGRPISQRSDLAALYAQRAPLYARFADAVIDNNGTPEETVRKILEVLA